jgi:hypothetical protein
MPFKPGQSGNPAGRKPGTLRKTTVDVRAAIAQFAQDNVEQMSAWLCQIVDPAKRLDLYLRAIEYHIPKLGRMELTGANGGPVQTERIERLIVDPANPDRPSLPPAA